MSDRITLDDTQLRGALGRLVAAARAPVRPTLERIAQKWRSLVLLGFKEGRGPDGTPWLPLRVREGGQPLLDTGALRSSIGDRVEGETIELGTGRGGKTTHYAAVQQFGATIKPRPENRHGLLVFRVRGGRWFALKEAVIPARPFLPQTELPPVWVSGAQRILADALRRAAAGEAPA